MERAFPLLSFSHSHTQPEMAAVSGDSDSWDSNTFSLEEPVRKAGGAAGGDHWEGKNEDDDVKENWDDDDEEKKKKEETEVKPETKVSEKKKIAEKIKEKERQQKKRQKEIKKRLEEPEESKEITLEEQLADKVRLNKLQEEADLELAKETFGVNNTICGIDAMNPSSRDDFTEFGKLLKDKITQYEKSLYYASFLEALVRYVCISLEIDDLKNITNSLTVLCSEKQKQEKQSKAKKKKSVVPGGGLKATMKDDLADYGGYDGGYVQDSEDFM
ncbi:LOW QUALITY PROTEIN: eukaryotic translation initiation factor 3 subunit J-like [Dromiciops gliroides]|uniref:LOW QUALITY PROTEIN: eukaryotic translation initiation factor 3 subunit J-like n=1 Tax=Dromiciops gliroides TaxID=33562 RepID=UPI001CC56C92|nr:LOW QUALITY PROTEIN: eukaryotic translation initiation factor 3 subunit J-like [Dromiciops gliroides]